jgi:hypothetical protein
MRFLEHLGCLARSTGTRLLLAALIASSLLASCSRSEPRDDFLQGIPCAAPCWEGIVPGQTGEESVVAVISNPDLVLQDSVERVSGDDPSVIGYYFRLAAGIRPIGIILRNDTVSTIRIGLPRDLALQDVVGTFVRPEFVYVKDAGQDRQCFATTLYDLAHGIEVTGGICQGEGDDEQWMYVGDGTGKTYANVFPEMGIGDIWFFEPRPDLRSALTDSLYVWPERAQEILYWAQPWTGFGLYEVNW